VFQSGLPGKNSATFCDCNEAREKRTLAKKPIKEVRQKLKKRGGGRCDGTKKKRKTIITFLEQVVA